MQEITFSDGYYSKYSPTNKQVKLVGVNYNKGALLFAFEDKDLKIHEKSSREPLEMLVLSEILYGSQLWKYQASIEPTYNGRQAVSIVISVDNTFVNDYKDISVGFKVYISTVFSKLGSYGNHCSYPKLREISYISYYEPIQQPPNFKVNLFEYQKKSIAKMLAIEKGEADLTCEYNYNIPFGEVNINFNPHKGTADDSECKIIIKTKGGILADDMGLGKTITSLAVVALNPSTYTEEYKDGLIYSNATLIVCPSHLAKQWEDEVKKVFPTANIIKLLTKNSHVKLTYKEIHDADIIIVTQQFLMNFKYYPMINYKPCTPSSIVTKNRFADLKTVLQNWVTNEEDIMIKEQPNLEHFSFHRLIVDEGHEIFGLQLSNTSMSRYMFEWLEQVNSSYNWFISGTPFVNYEGLRKCFDFINLKLYENKSGTIMNTVDFATKTYLVDQVLSNVMIRHRKIDVENQIHIPGYEEDVVWVKLTELEKGLYQSKKNSSSSDIVLQQLCCHILVSDTTSKYFGNTEIDLSSMQDELLKYHEKTIETYEAKLENLDPTNQAYSMVKKNYQTKLSESKYMLTILKKMGNKEDLDLEQNCSICFDQLNNPSLTSCGHLFCKDCLDMCLQFKKSCPMCKTDLTGKEIYLVDSKKDEDEVVEEDVNPLIKKYGSKLGKLISIVRTLVANDNNRIIIFSQWDRMLNLIGKSLCDNGVANSFIKGNVWSRNSAINKFKLGKDSTGEDNKVIMLSLSNSASGTNLTEATHIIFVEPINAKNEEVKAVEAQAIGRACRLGQKNKIKVIRILTQNTIEEQIYEKIYSKNMDNIKRTIIVEDNDVIV
jgi:SNF2 family DNA or RNA helicase|uniref:RING-type domain-containing protein n=1 Tax=viral metagenome TaxID=1070528 RepID=A0A6C0IT07_9ZZZZ